MPSVQQAWIGLALAVASLATTLHAQAPEVHRDAELHWSATPPPGWTPMSAAIIEKFNAEAQRLATAKPAFRYIGGYRQDPQGVYPYILIQVTPGTLSGTTYADLERELGAGARHTNAAAPEALNAVMSDLKAGVQKLDRATNRVYLSLEADIVPLGRMKGVCVGFLGKDGIVQFNCYSKAAEFEADMPTFERFVESFSYDPGYAFVARAGGLDWKGIGVKAAIGALIGLLIGGAYYLRRKKPGAV